MRTLLRLLGLVLVVTACTTLGIGCAAHFRRRVRALENARALLVTLRQQLSFTLAPPGELIGALAGDPLFCECDYLRLAAEGCAEQPFLPAWQQAVWQSAVALQDGDRRMLQQAGEILGASDLQTQCEQLALITERFEHELQTARERCEANTKLATTLGALLGLAIAVLLL